MIAVPQHDDLLETQYQDYRETLLERIRRLEAGRRGLDAPPPENPLGDDWPQDPGYLEMIERARRQTDAEIAELREAVRLLDRLDSYSDVDDDVSASISGLGAVVTSSVTDNETLFGTVDRHIDEWRGSAADAFDERVNKIHDLLNKQSAYATVLSEHLRQYAKLGACATTATQQLTTAMIRAMEAIDEHVRQQQENALELLTTLATVTVSASSKDVVGAGVAGAGYLIKTTMIQERLTVRNRTEVVTEIQRLAHLSLTSLSAAAAAAARAINETVAAMRHACDETFPVRPAILDVRSPDFSYANFQYHAGMTADERRFLDDVGRVRDRLYRDQD